MRLPEHSRGAAATVLFHWLLLLFLLSAGFKTKLPLPGEQGIAIDLGTEQTGELVLNPEMDLQAESVQPQRPRTEKDAFLTQDYEEAPGLPQTAQAEPDKVKPADTKPDKESSNTVAAKNARTDNKVEPEKPAERKVNQRALFTGKNVSTAPAGESDAKADGKAGSPTGSQGAAAGPGGIGNSFDLAGRSLASPLPRPAYVGQNEGVVVVNITVDKEGRVIQAKFSLAGSTTTDEQLVAAALKAAEQTHFNRQPDAPVQAGRITYTFKLQD